MAILPNGLYPRKLVSWTCLSSLCFCLPLHLQADEEIEIEEIEEKANEKNPEDPTKVVTRLGAGYNGDFTINGSIGLDKARMISGFINEDASEWRLGGSWLFEKGIVNFNFKKTQYDSGGDSISYNIGTFVPLSVFGFEPCGWQIFPSFGFNYTDGEIRTEPNPLLPESAFMVPIDSKGIYLGAFTLKPINDQWTFMCGVGGSYGSDDTTNVYGGLGISYRLTKKQSFNLFYSASESSEFGTNDTLSINYRFEFN